MTVMRRTETTDAALPHAEAAESCLRRLAATIDARDQGAFLGEIVLCSASDRRQLATWFKGYTTAGLALFNWRLEALDMDGEYVLARVGVWLTFEAFDPVSEVFRFWMTPAGGVCRITGFEQTRRLGVCAAPGQPAAVPGWADETSESATIPWPDTEPGEFDAEFGALLEQAAAIPDPEPATVYADYASPGMGRLEGSLEKRMAHLLANLMSGTTAAVAARARDGGGEPARAVHSLIGGISPGYPEETRSATTSSHNWPWLLSDEMAGFARSSGRVYYGTCQSLAELVVSVLRLLGAGPDEAFLAELHLHNAALYLGEPALMFSNQALVVCGPRTVHWNRVVAAFWNDEFGWRRDKTILNAGGATAAYKRMEETVPFLRAEGGWPAGLAIDAVGSLGLGRLGCARITDGAPVASPAAMSLAAKAAVFRLAAASPLSHYARARYTLQTLLVRRPEAYLARSQATEPVHRMAGQFPHTDSFLAYVASNIKDGSIFPESHRLMTGDQVLRYGLADDKARALLLAAYFAARRIPAAVAWSEEGWFSLADEGDGIRVYRSKTLQRATRVGGWLLLLFDATGSLYPLLDTSCRASGTLDRALLGRWSGGLEPGFLDGPVRLPGAWPRP